MIISLRKSERTLVLIAMVILSLMLVVACEGNLTQPEQPGAGTNDGIAVPTSPPTGVAIEADPGAPATMEQEGLTPRAETNATPMEPSAPPTLSIPTRVPEAAPMPTPLAAPETAPVQTPEETVVPEPMTPAAAQPAPPTLVAGPDIPSPPATGTIPSTEAGVDPRFESISLGWNHACGVRTDGTPYCWGMNAHGKAEPLQGLSLKVGHRRNSPFLRPEGRWRSSMLGRRK